MLHFLLPCTQPNKSDLYALYEASAMKKEPPKDLLSGESIQPLVPTISTAAKSSPMLPQTQSARFRAIDQLYDNTELQQQIEEAAKDADKRKGKSAINVGDMSPVTPVSQRKYESKQEPRHEVSKQRSSKTSQRSAASVSTQGYDSYYQKNPVPSAKRQDRASKSASALSRQLSSRLSLSDDATLTPRSPNVDYAGYTRKSSRRDNGRSKHLSPADRSDTADRRDSREYQRSNSNPRPRRQIEEANPALARMIDPRKQVEPTNQRSQKPRRERPVSPNSDYDASSHSSSSRSPPITPGEPKYSDRRDQRVRAPSPLQRSSHSSRTETSERSRGAQAVQPNKKPLTFNQKENAQQGAVKSITTETAPKQETPKKKSFIGSLFGWGNREEDDLVAVSVRNPVDDAKKPQEDASERRRRKEQIVSHHSTFT